jgi:hypothetical protein
MTVLDDNRVPYGVAPGNHDQAADGTANMFDKYFPVSRFLNTDHPWYMGYLGQETTDPINRENKNNYELFSVGGLDFLVIHIEMDWPDYAVSWADKIIKRYPNRRVILSTHLFLDTTNTRPTAKQFRSNGTSAEAVWQQIIKPNCNVFMVVTGTIRVGRRTDRTPAEAGTSADGYRPSTAATAGYALRSAAENKICLHVRRRATAAQTISDHGNASSPRLRHVSAPFTVIGTVGRRPGANAAMTWAD